MADFNPANTIFRNGLEALGPGLPASSASLGLGDHRLGPGGELVSPTFNGVPVGEIDGLGVDQGDVLTTVALGPKAINMRLRNDVGSLRYLARFLRHSATPTTPSGATLTREHIWSRTETDIDFDSTLTVEVARDNGFAWSHRGCDVQQIIFTFEGGELKNIQAVVMWRHFTMFDEVTVVVPGASANAEEASLTGLLSQANFDLGDTPGDDTVFIQIADITNIAATPIPSVTAFAKVGVGGGAGVYGPDSFVIQGGLKSNGEPRLNEVLDSTGLAPIGTCRLPVYVASTDLTDWEVLDEWSWARKVPWTPTLGTAPPFNSACARITLDGELNTILNSGTITLTRGLALPGDGSWIGSGFPLELSDAGKVRHEITFAKDQKDTEIIEKIVYGKTFDVSFELKTDTAIDAGTQYAHRMLLNMKDCRVTGGAEHKTATDDVAREETITCVASNVTPVEAIIWTPETTFET